VLVNELVEVVLLKVTVVVAEKVEEVEVV